MYDLDFSARRAGMPLVWRRAGFTALLNHQRLELRAGLPPPSVGNA